MKFMGDGGAQWVEIVLSGRILEQHTLLSSNKSL